jgi:hypothetical protein
LPTVQWLNIQNRTAVLCSSCDINFRPWNRKNNVSFIKPSHLLRNEMQLCETTKKLKVKSSHSILRTFTVLNTRLLWDALCHLVNKYNVQYNPTV